MKIKTEKISLPLLNLKEIELFVKRIDLLDPLISGNKFYKLKYNMLEAIRQKKKYILTFGGAYSNHIASTAFAANKFGFKSIGIIRGEMSHNLNYTLRFAKENGMKIHYISREQYRKKHTVSFLNELKDNYKSFYLIPEGGANSLAIKGTEEILDKENHDYICCPVGTGGTISGIINSSQSHMKILGFPAMKGNNDLSTNIESWTNEKNWCIINNYHFGGYAKITKELIDFTMDFNFNQKIPLDVIYTSKMMYGIIDLIKKDYFPRSSSILAIHTGGIQGNIGMNDRYNLNLPHYL
tara:strand:- start:355 stop:1242 length:888 start_codon:yes stop_codon:yes gene_type:complete